LGIYYGVVFGFIMMGAFVASLAKDLFGESVEKSKELYRLEIYQTEADLLKPCRFPLRTQALNTLSGYAIVHIHDDGDLTVRSQGKLYVVTTEGEIFEQKMNLSMTQILRPYVRTSHRNITIYYAGSGFLYRITASPLNLKLKNARLTKY
jgi:hypothetical protein